jgi:hypothetical protein
MRTVRIAAAAAALAIIVGATAASAARASVINDSASPISRTPLRVALQLFSIDLGALGLFGWRGKGKVRVVLKNRRNP